MRSTCAQAVRELGGAIVGEPAPRRRRGCRLVVVAHRDDERETELRLVGVVERGEPRALGVGQRVEPGAGLLGGRIPAVSRLRRRELAREVGVGRENAEPLVLAAPTRKARASALCDADGGVVGGAELERVGPLGDPRRMLEDAAEARDEVAGASASRAGARARGRRVASAQWRAISQPGREPDARRGPGVVEEPRERRGPARPPDQPAVQADRHHLRRAGRALRVEHVEAVLEVGVEVVAVV